MHTSCQLQLILKTVTKLQILFFSQSALILKSEHFWHYFFKLSSFPDTMLNRQRELFRTEGKAGQTQGPTSALYLRDVDRQSRNRWRVVEERKCPPTVTQQPSENVYIRFEK